MQADLRMAIKARNAAGVSALRTTLAAFANAEAVDTAAPVTSAGLFADVDRRPLSDQDVLTILAREQHEYRAAAQRMRDLGLVARAVELDRRAAILASYLPAP
jgi:uncharacterized protein